MTAHSFDLDAVRAQFPILAESIHGRRLAYLDNGATTQKPLAVLQRMDHYYRHENANVHRAVHELSARATTAYEGARDRIAAFLGTNREQLIFTRGTTDAINLVARSFLEPLLQAGDEILLTGMEHHSNIVSWQLAAARSGARIVAAGVRDDGSLDLDDWRAKLSSRTKMAAMVHVSNTLGTVNPLADMLALAAEHGVPTLVDGAQAIAHLPVNFNALGADFYVASSHKAYGPTGFGVLLGRSERLQAMEPLQGGGDMIATVSFEGSTWNELPYKFEAGTPDIAGAIGFAEAVDWIRSTGLQACAEHEHALLMQASERLQALPGLRIIGTAPGKSAIISFVVDGTHAHDLGSMLDQAGVAVRTGHHCTMPLMARFGVSATARASFAAYNGQDDIDQLLDGLRTAIRLLS